MATQVNPGSIIRRGAAKLTAAEMLELSKNQNRVDEIIAEIDARRDRYLEAVKDATDRQNLNEQVDLDLMEKAGQIEADRSALVDAKSEHAGEVQDKEYALRRREEQVRERETTLDAQAVAAQEAIDETNVQLNARGAALLAREESIEAREETIEEREQDLLSSERSAKANLERIENYKKRVTGVQF